MTKLNVFFLHCRYSAEVVSPIGTVCRNNKQLLKPCIIVVDITDDVHVVGILSTTRFEEVEMVVLYEDKSYVSIINRSTSVPTITTSMVGDNAMAVARLVCLHIYDVQLEYQPFPRDQPMST